MTGGLLNLASEGNQNVILNGNPSKTFFKSVYAKYTNFGMQKFRIDKKDTRKLFYNEESKFTFTIPRYAELLMDTYLVLNIPDIWSPIYKDTENEDSKWVGYEFKWIENLGSQIIKEVEFNIGGQIIQKYSGSYLLAKKQRDNSVTKMNLYDKMTGNVPELNEPENAEGRKNMYPHVYYQTDT